MIRRIRFVLFLILAAPATMAADFNEDFESFSLLGFDPTLKPDQDWYNYAEKSDVGNVTADVPIPEATQAFRMSGDTNATDISVRRAQFGLEIPTQLSFTSFNVTSPTIADNGVGSQQYVALRSGAPVRSIVEFYVFCTNATFTDGCEFRVRFDYVDSQGQILVNASLSDNEFFVNVTMDWINAEFCLEVDGVDDGCFPMLDLPTDFGRIEFGQFRLDIPWEMTFDNWTVADAEEGFATTNVGDVATGLKNWATDVSFTSRGSLFFLGLIILFILLAAVIVPLVALGLDNSIVPAVGFFGILAVLWLIFMEWWPDWIGIAMIIVVSSYIGLTLRRVTLGIRDASSGAGLVIGTLGYFIIASTFLGFSGYAAQDVELPTGQPDIVEDVGNATTDEQSFVGAVAECVISGGLFTFGLKGDCSQDTVGTTWKKITDAAGTIFNWARTGFDYLFQLLTFQLPIPVIFNMMIVLPPAVGLASYAISVIRGAGS